MALTIKQRAHEVIEAVSDDATWQERLCALELRRGRARRRRYGWIAVSDGNRSYGHTEDLGK
jgi:hypothetical protein